MKENQSTDLLVAYMAAKAKSGITGKEVARKYLDQGHSMLSMVVHGKAVSRPVLKGVINFIHDVDPGLVPKQYGDLVPVEAMETVGEDS